MPKPADCRPLRGSKAPLHPAVQPLRGICSSNWEAVDAAVLLLILPHQLLQQRSAAGTACPLPRTRRAARLAPQVYGLLQRHVERDAFLKQLELAKVARGAAGAGAVAHGSEVLRETWWEAPAGEGGAADAGDPAAADAGFTEASLHLPAHLCDGGYLGAAGCCSVPPRMPPSIDGIHGDMESSRQGASDCGCRVGCKYATRSSPFELHMLMMACLLAVCRHRRLSTQAHG